MEPKQVFCDQKLPRFIAQNLKSNTQIFYNIDNPQIHHQRRIDELHGRRIRGCFHGWVILSNRRKTSLWSLWNPLTSKLILLPPLPLTYEGKDTYQCCLSSPPDVQGSVFLLLSSTVHTIVFCRLDCKRKRLKWTETSYAKKLHNISGERNCFLYNPTCCNGKVYAMTMPIHPHLLIELDIVVKSEEAVISLVPSLEFPRPSFDPRPSRNDRGVYREYPFLEGTCMDLFYIVVKANFVDEMIKDVYLFKLDMSSMMWKEVVDFQDAVFFIQLDDYQTCYYSSAVGSELGGYIHIHYGSSKIIHSFHVKNRTISLSSMSFPIQESQAYAWAMLEEWRLEVDHVESKQEEHDKDTKIVVRPVKGDKIVFDSTMSESDLLNMPLDILELIMEHCIAVEYMKFRATCKHCYLASPSIQWSNKTSLSRLKSYSLVSPWLMVLDNDRDTITFIDPLFGDKYFIQTPQELRDGYRIYCSRYGWLLMYKGEREDEERLMFFNPFTSNIIELPEVHYLESFCFSAPPTSPDCMVVGFTTYRPSNLYIHFVSQDSIWHKYRLNFGGDPCSYQFPAFSGRDIYALCNNEKIEAFRDITIDDYSWESVADKGPRSRCKSQARYFFSKCDQHLLLIIVGHVRGESVEVFKLNQSTGEWEKIDGLGKHMIYISNTSCICLEATSPEMGNKIYFPRLLHKEDSKIVFYSLETCRYHTFDDKIIQESFGADLFGTKYLFYPHTWIEPSWC